MIKRRFLAADEPLLPAIARMLVDRCEDDIDLRTHCIVLPTARACRRLTQLLAETSGNRPLLAPRILTIAGLLQQCIVPRRAIAPPLAVSIAWSQALAGAGEEDCASLTGHGEPPGDRERVALAVRLQGIVRELAGADCSPTDVAAVIAADHLPMKASLWCAIDRLRRAMLDVLSEAGLDDPEERQHASLHRGDLLVDGMSHLWVVAADPPHRERLLLNGLDAAGVEVTSLIHADETALGDAFDASGWIDQDFWSERRLELDDGAIHCCDGVQDQAGVVLGLLAGRGDVDSAAVRLILPDTTIASGLIRSMALEGVHIRPAEGTSAAQGRIGSFMCSLHGCLQSSDADAWAALMRHPDVERLVGPDALQRWDAAWARSMPRSIDDLPEAVRQSLLDPIRDLLGPMLDDRVAPASTWAAPCARLLQAVFGDCDNPTPEDFETLSLIETHLQQLHEVPPGVLGVRCEAVIGALVQILSASATTPAPRADAIDCAGWLDAHLDDAPLCIITSMNEGVLPGAPASDPWLPQGLRARIGLPTARSRFARDVWLMHAVLHSGREVAFIVPRRGAEGDPLMPSRLLLGERGEALARRTLSLVETSDGSASMASRRSAPSGPCTFDDLQLPEGRPDIRSIPVTAFKTWYSDPLTFLLQRDRRIRAGEVDAPVDLDARTFGTHMHKVVQRWGEQEVQRGGPTTDAATIERDVVEVLHTLTRERFGAHPRAGIRLQQAIAAHRLKRFAREQALHAQAGWKVMQVETSWGFNEDEHDPIRLGSGDGLPITGRIDRIDLHAEHGLMAIDYKTGTKVKHPDTEHRSSDGTWTDLQLPLYAALMASIDMEVEGNRLGYMLLAPSEDAAGFVMARFSAGDLVAARSEAASIVDIVTSDRLLETIEEACSE